VWDIGVEDAHEFVAEGVVVHNCWRELLEPHGWMSERFINQKKLAVSEEMWRCLPTGEPVQTLRGDVPIEQIRQGDEVWTRQGWRPVTALVRQNDRLVYTVITNDGRSYRATANHKAATPSGWVETGNLQVGDTLVTADPLHVLAFAGKTSSVTSRVDASFRSRVSVDADVPGSVKVALAGVVGTRDDLQMSGFDATGDVARVVHGQAVWELTVPCQVGQAMGVVNAAHPADAVPVLCDRSSPDSASFDSRLGPRQDVGLQVVRTGTCHVVSVRRSDEVVSTWDISVLGTHEFTVNGIVVHNTEYELNEPSGSSRAFDLTALEKVFVDYGDPIDYQKSGEDDQQWVWEDPVPNALYATGADWGKEVDKTIIATIRYDINPRKLVALHRVKKTSYKVMIKAFDDRLKRYGGVAQHDKTGLGNVVNDFSDAVEDNGQVTGFNFSDRRKRSQMLLHYVTDLEQGGYSLPRGHSRNEEGLYLSEFHKAHRNATVEDVYGSHKWNAHLPDDVAAMALAARAAGRIPQDLEAQGVPINTAPRQVDAPFHTKPSEDEWEIRSTGDVQEVDDRYLTPIADFGFMDLSS